MKKLLTYAFLLLFFCQTLQAGGWDFLQRFHPGLEWGYTAPLANKHHFNYLDESIGYRINDEGWTYPHHTNAFILGSVNFDISKHLSCSLLSGYQGINKHQRVVPVILRMKCWMKDREEDGIYIFSEGGMSFQKETRRSNQIQLGTGYSFVMTPRFALAFQLGGRLTYSHPRVWDAIEEEYISARNIKRNDAWYYALNLGISLTF